MSGHVSRLCPVAGDECWCPEGPCLSAPAPAPGRANLAELVGRGAEGPFTPCPACPIPNDCSLLRLCARERLPSQVAIDVLGAERA